MSQDSVAIVQRILAAWATGDFRSGVDYFDQHVVFVLRPDFPDSGVFVGLDGVKNYTQRFLEPWERLTIEAKHIRAVGDTVLVHIADHGKGRASGIEADLSYFTLFTFRGTKIVRMESVMDESEALEAAGLSEQAMSQENVEIVRAWFEAWNAGDMDTIRELYDPHVLIRFAEGWPEGSEPILGREAVMRGLEQFRETWDTEALEPVTLIDAGDRIVIRQIWRAVGHGPDLNMEFTGVTTMRKGKIIFTELFWSHAEALEALGLSEQDAHADS